MSVGEGETKNWAHRCPHDLCWCVVGMDNSYVEKIMGTAASWHEERTFSIADAQAYEPVSPHPRAFAVYASNVDGGLAHSDDAPWHSATIVPVPNQPKTPVSTFRIPLDLKAAVKAKAEDRGDDMTAIVVKAFEDYLKKK